MANYFEEKFAGNKGIAFMENAEKHDLSELFDGQHVITDFAFIDGEDGEYAVFCVADKPGVFYFGSKPITADLRQIADDGQKGMISVAKWEFYSAKSKKGRSYSAMRYAGSAK